MACTCCFLIVHICFLNNFWTIKPILMPLHIDHVDSRRGQNTGFQGSGYLACLKTGSQTKIWTFEQFLHENNAKLATMLTLHTVRFLSSSPIWPCGKYFSTVHFDFYVVAKFFDFFKSCQNFWLLWSHPCRAPMSIALLGLTGKCVGIGFATARVE